MGKKKNINVSTTSKIRWGSKLGFIMTAAGAAVGLGNLQRFPQLVSQHGGGAFLLLYLICVILFAFPLMLAEFSLGRSMRSNPIKSFEQASPNNKSWKYVGMLSVLVAFCILSYYIISCTWTLGFVFKHFMNYSNDNISFASITKNPKSVSLLFIIFHSFITLVVLKGLNKGVEKFSKIVMPLMFIMQLILIIKIMFIKGSLEGFIYYLKPNFSNLKPDSLFHALSQAFFSLCIGEAVLLTYGSYASKSESLSLSAIYIMVLDTGVAFFAGLIIMPAIFITGQDPEQGISLIYNTLYDLFNQFKGGSIFLVLYFTILTIAGLTTCISLLDVSSNSFASYMKVSRKKSVLLVSFAALLLGIPSLLSGGGVDFFTNMIFLGQKGFLNIMDFLWGSVGMVISGLLTTIFVGWIWGTENAMKELSLNSSLFLKIQKLWAFHIKWTGPIVILYILKSLIKFN